MLSLESFYREIDRIDNRREVNYYDSLWDNSPKISHSNQIFNYAMELLEKESEEKGEEEKEVLPDMTVDQLLVRALGDGNFNLPVVSQPQEVHEDMMDDFRISPNEEDIISGSGKRILRGVREKRDGYLMVSFVYRGKPYGVCNGKTYTVTSPMGTYEICGNKAYIIDSPFTESFHMKRGQEKLEYIVCKHDFVSPQELIPALKGTEEGMIADIDGQEFRIKRVETRDGIFISIPTPGIMKLSTGLIRFDHMQFKAQPPNVGDVVEYRVHDMRFERVRKDKTFAKKKYNDRPLMSYAKFLVAISNPAVVIVPYSRHDNMSYNPKMVFEIDNMEGIDIYANVSVVRSVPLRVIARTPDFRMMVILQFLGYQIMGDKCYVGTRVKIKEISFTTIYHNMR